MANTSPAFASQSCPNRSTGSRVVVGDQSLTWRASVITVALDLETERWEGGGDGTGCTIIDVIGVI